MSATPRLDAIREWLAGDRLGPIHWPEERWPDPPAWDDYGRRIEAVLQMCASGAQAEFLPRSARIGGRLVPPPPDPQPFKHGPRNHPPRPRKVNR